MKKNTVNFMFYYNTIKMPYYNRKCIPAKYVYLVNVMKKEKHYVTKL